MREARLAAGLSVQALAARAGVGESAVSRIERGIGQPRPYVARRLSAALGLPPMEVREFRPVMLQLVLRRPNVTAD